MHWVVRTASYCARLKGAVAVALMLALAWIGGRPTRTSGSESSARPPKAVRTYDGRGIVEGLKLTERQVILQHEAIADYMDAMTMSFRILAPEEFAGLQPGDQITFRLSVTDEASWIDHVTRIGRGTIAKRTPISPVPKASTAAAHPLLTYAFTNEFGQPVRLNDFRGQALAYSFFFTRCPLPEYCPRLARNFEEASRTLTTRPDAPTNWHFLSISFDPQFDSPAVLRAYAQRYRYDSNHWSFITGPADKVKELAALSDVTYESDSASLYTHTFRTLVINPAGQLQMSFPIGGNLSDALVSEILKATTRSKPE